MWRGGKRERKLTREKSETPTKFFQHCVCVCGGGGGRKKNNNNMNFHANDKNMATISTMENEMYWVQQQAMEQQLPSLNMWTD
jgi:hypothetical protein